jgi:hypothetical protein
MLEALRDITLNLIASLIFAGASAVFVRRRTAAEPNEPSTPNLGTSTTRAHELPALDLSTSRPERKGLSFDAYSFLWLSGLSLTVVVPFLLGAVTLAVVDTVTHGDSVLITDQMREHGGHGYVQYWLGFTVLALIEIGVLLLRPWRGRTFGVVLGLALAVLLVVFAVPASRGESLLFG